jgi:hypothetical protein
MALAWRVARAERAPWESKLSDAPPLGYCAREAEKAQRDRGGDMAFIEAGLALLDPEARRRAGQVRLKPGDPARERIAEWLLP